MFWNLAQYVSAYIMLLIRGRMTSKNYEENFENIYLLKIGMKSRVNKSITKSPLSIGEKY